MENKKEVISFRKKILAGEKGILSERIKADGTVETIRVRFYIGQELYLKVMPYIRHRGNKVEYPITVVGGDYWLTGDDDNFVFDVVIPVNNDDEFVVEFENTSSYDYNLAVDVTIDYYAGQNRIVGGVI